MIIHGEKINKARAYAVKAVVDAGGACIVSDWTNGSGRNTRRRTTPAFCEELIMWKGARGADFTIEYYELRGVAAKAVRNIYKKHPRAAAAIVCTDIRGARKAIRAMEAA